MSTSTDDVSRTEPGTKRSEPDSLSTKPQGALFKKHQQEKKDTQPEETILERDIPTIRTQIEYYLSDKNLAIDQYFFDLIQKDENGMLPFDKIMGCKKIQAMKADIDLIKEAAKESTQIDVIEGGLRRKGNKPLPEFKGRPELPKGERRGNGRGGSPQQKKMFNKGIKPIVIHENGCLMTIKNLHEDMTWNVVKDAVNKVFDKEFEGVKTHSGKDATPVNFCAQKDSNGVIRLVITKKQDDIKLLKECKEIEIDGDKFPFFLENDQAVATAFFKALPKLVAKTLTPKPFSPRVCIGEGENKVEFESLEFLRTCCKELLDATNDGDEVGGKGQTVLRFLLAHHPDKSKADKMKTVLAGIHPASNASKPFKTFFAVKEDGERIDFSYLKCINNYALKLVEAETLTMRSATPATAAATPAPATEEEATTTEAPEEEKKDE